MNGARAAKREQLKSDMLQFMQRYKANAGYAPAVRDFAQEFGVSTSTVKTALDDLQRAGRISREPGKARTIVVLDPPTPAQPGEQ